MAGLGREIQIRDPILWSANVLSKRSTRPAGSRSWPAPDWADPFTLKTTSRGVNSYGSPCLLGIGSHCPLVPGPHLPTLVPHPCNTVYLGRWIEASSTWHKFYFFKLQLCLWNWNLKWKRTAYYIIKKSIGPVKISLSHHMIDKRRWKNYSIS